MWTSVERGLQGLMLVSAILLISCHPSAEPERAQVDLGDHHAARFAIPIGWLHIDHGRIQRFENGSARFELIDLGAASPEGFAETLRVSRSLFRDDQWEDARALLDGVDPRLFFSTEAGWDAIERHWKRIRTVRRREAFRDETIGGGGIPSTTVWDVESAYHDLLVAVGALPSLDLDTLGESTRTVSRRPAADRLCFDATSCRPNRSRIGRGSPEIRSGARCLARLNGVAV